MNAPVDAPAPAEPTRSAEPTGTAGPLEPRRRGRLVLAARVVEKIAGQAASEVAAASGRSGGFLGLGADADAHARPRVDVTLHDRSTDLALAVGIAYPGSIRRATDDVRAHVTRRVEALTGLEVHRVDVDVTFLTRAAEPGQTALR